MEFQVNEPLAEYQSKIYWDESYTIQGAVFEVYREMGAGFLEAVYQDCLEKELTLRGIPFQSQVMLPIYYKNELIQHVYIADIVCYDKIILELKAMSEVDNIHRAQLMNYLKATGMKLGLLINFGHHPLATVERIIY